MQGTRFTIAAHAHGTLSANFVGRFKLPQSATLLGVEFSCSSATAATLDFGPASDPDGIIDGGAVGQSDAVAFLDRDDWNGVLYLDADNIDYYRLDAGTVYQWTVIHASAQNVDLIFHLAEG